MANYDSSGNNVEITSGSLTASWVARCAAAVRRPLSAIQHQGRPLHIFVDDELLVDARDTATLQHLTEQHDAVVLPPLAVPPQPRGMNPDRQRSVEGMPRTLRVRVRGDRVALSALETAVGQQAEGRLQVTSRAGAGTLALAHRLGGEGRRVLLNSVGQSHALPRSASTEGPRIGDTSDAYQWPEFAGPARVNRGWQLIDAYAQARSLSTPVYLGIFDAGFNLDANGQPQAPVGQTPDVTSFVQYNLDDEGANASGTNNESGKEWHGNAVLSVAAAPLNNNAGAAGAGGVTRGGAPVVIPVLFKNFRTIAEVFRCLELSVAWGVDVINMSFSIEFPKILLPISAHWDDNFQFAKDQGVVIVVSAGNNGEELPDLVLFPATRTPGTVTVGALDGSGIASRSDSNYGSSVDIWAPGTNMHVMPDPTSPNGSFWSQTSFAAPVVAGTVALMKSLQATLHTDDVKRILRETGRTDSPDSKVAVHLDAYAALLRVMGDRLPDGTFEEPNNTPQTARPMVADASGVLKPISVTTLSLRADQDWYQFSVSQYSSCVIDLTYVPELSSASLELVPDDPLSAAAADAVSVVISPRQRQLFCSVIAPGSYRVVVRGNGPNIYELQLRLSPKPLVRDMFEVNDRLETAATFTLRKPGSSIFEPPPALRGFGPGTYDANFHVATDVDFFHVKDIEPLIIAQPVFRIDASDAPLDVILFGPDRQPIQQLHGQRTVRLVLPAPECWVKVSSATVNRYTLKVRREVSKDTVPGPFQDQDLIPIPDWWPDPPFSLDTWEQFLQVEITDELKAIGTLRLMGTPGLTLELMSPAGETIASGTKAEAGVEHALDIDLNAVAAGTHIVRIGRSLNPGERLNRRLGQSQANFTLGPPF
jgi:hypothetical protein